MLPNDSPTLLVYEHNLIKSEEHCTPQSNLLTKILIFSQFESLIRLDVLMMIHENLTEKGFVIVLNWVDVKMYLFKPDKNYSKTNNTKPDIF